MSNTTTAPAAETAQDAPEAAEQPDTPQAAETPATDAHSAAQANTGDEHQGDNPDDDEHQGDADTFPRRVVEKLRKENTALRDRVRAAEDRAQAAEAARTALQQQAADEAIEAAGLKPAAVWHDSKLADVLADDGTIDRAKLTAAMKTAMRTLDVIPRRPVPRPGAGAPLRSGAGVPLEKPNTWVNAFGPRPK